MTWGWGHRQGGSRAFFIQGRQNRRTEFIREGRQRGGSGSGRLCTAANPFLLQLTLLLLPPAFLCGRRSPLTPPQLLPFCKLHVFFFFFQVCLISFCNGRRICSQQEGAHHFLLLFPKYKQHLRTGGCEPTTMHFLGFQRDAVARKESIYPMAFSKPPFSLWHTLLLCLQADT